MGTRATDHPVDLSMGITAFINASLGFLVVFGYVHWTTEQIAVVGTLANLLLQGLAWWFLRRHTTSRAKPTTAEGIPLVPVVKPPTRGIEKG